MKRLACALTLLLFSGGCDWAEKAEHGGLDNSDWKTPVLIYSSASGAYAGIKLERSKISTDDQTMRDLYGPNATLQTIFGANYLHRDRRSRSWQL